MLQFLAFSNRLIFTLLLNIFAFHQYLYAQNVNVYNWAGNVQYSTQTIQWPRSVAQVKQIVKSANKLRCMGQKHSFNRIGDSNDTILANLGLKNIVNPLIPVGPLHLVGINPLDPTVTVQAGLTYTDLGPFLEFTNYALPNLAALAELSIAGASQTGAHGSGNTLGCLSTHIRSMQIVRADGTEETIKRTDSRLKALAVGLGAFGVITSMELELVPYYNVTKHVFLNLSHEEFMQNFDAIMAVGYSVVVFADFLLPGVWSQVWVIVRSDANSDIGTQEFLLNTKAIRTTEHMSPMMLMPSTYISKQDVEQPWYFGLVGYQLGTLAGADYRNSISGIGSGADEIQSEYFVAHENATKAIDAVYKYSKLLAPVIWYVAIRTVKCDDLWLSPSRCRVGQSDNLVVAIHLCFKPTVALINPVLKQVEAELIKFDARPHWGKYFLMGPEDYLYTYEKLDEFVELANKMDPKGKFRNDFLDNYVFAYTKKANNIEKKEFKNPECRATNCTTSTVESC